MLGPAHPAAGAERLHHQFRLLERTQDETDEGGEVRQVECVGERGDVRRGQRVATGEGVGDPVVGHEDAGHGLLLQPLPDVALGGAGTGGQLRRRQRALGERPVVAQPVPEIDRLQVQGGEDGTEEAFDEGVGGTGFGGRGVDDLGAGLEGGHGGLLSGCGATRCGGRRGRSRRAPRRRGCGRRTLRHAPEVGFEGQEQPDVARPVTGVAVLRQGHAHREPGEAVCDELGRGRDGCAVLGARPEPQARVVEQRRGRERAGPERQQVVHRVALDDHPLPRGQVGGRAHAIGDWAVGCHRRRQPTSSGGCPWSLPPAGPKVRGGPQAPQV